MKTGSKRQWETRHAIQRAWERYGLELSRSDVEQIGRLIRLGHSTPQRRKSNTRTVHAVDWHGQVVTVAYDKHRRCVVTFLPPKTPTPPVRKDER